MHKFDVEDTAQILLMASPDLYGISKPKEGAPVNEMVIEGYKEYIKDKKAFRKQAVSQWKNLRDVFGDYKIPTLDIGTHKRQSIVYTADPSLSLQLADGTLMTIFSRFSNIKRSVELEANAATFEKSFPDHKIVNAHYRTEGTGDNIYDAFRDVFWSGYTQTPGQSVSSGRSDRRAHDMLSYLTGVEVVSLEVQSPYFHIDTSFASLPGGHILVYKEGMTPESFEKMQRNAFDRFGLDRDTFTIEVSAEDAARYACNLRALNANTLVMTQCSDELVKKIEAKGYQVIRTDVDRFVLSGGAIHCLTNNVKETRIVGGYAAKNRLIDRGPQ